MPLRCAVRRYHHSLTSSLITNRHGVMNRTCKVELTMPPMLGAAMGFMISMPGPEDSGISDNDNTIVATVISFGRSRIVDPSMTASMNDWSCGLLANASRMKITMMMPV